MTPNSGVVDAVPYETPNTLSSSFLKRDEDKTELCLIVDDMHCAGCMRKIEKGLSALPDVTWARSNLSTKRVSVKWTGENLGIADIVDRLNEIGFNAVPFNPSLMATSGEDQRKTLLRAMAVAGFAAANIMLLSVSVWSGNAADMDAPTRDFFHWVTALIAMPTIAYAGQTFFQSAWSALKVRSLNMDVPISLAVILATAMSLYETIRGGQEVYFDAGVTLLFFLLIGRYLDLSMRSKACSAAQNLLGLRATAATRIESDGSHTQVPIEAILPGMKVAVTSGGRIPVDGLVVHGVSDIDMSLVTGESLPVSVKAGSNVFAGTLNLAGPLEIEVTKPEDDTLLAEIVRLMEAAEQGRAGFVRIADRVAEFYAPAVHILAAVAFLTWLIVGAGWHAALMCAIAVLIVTCPCALGLAVPVVQVVASGRLMNKGVLLKSSDGLERLAGTTHVVFDKTGTLTLGELLLVENQNLKTEDLAKAAALARGSRHPLSQAVVKAAKGLPPLRAEEVREVAGAGLEGLVGGTLVKLGSAAFLGLDNTETLIEGTSLEGPDLWVLIGDAKSVRLSFVDRLREDAGEVVRTLKNEGFKVSLLSGDRAEVAEKVAADLGIENCLSQRSPAGKIAALEAMTEAGDKLLMVGDGLNDAPALRAADTSMSPANAADVSQVAADLIFQGRSLTPVLEALHTAKSSRRLVLQNFALAALYNSIAIPLAFAGLVTPLVAAIAMSSSSILVTLNALRLSLGQQR
jgi:P-type Cu2+ transporter